MNKEEIEKKFTVGGFVCTVEAGEYGRAIIRNGGFPFACVVTHHAMREAAKAERIHISENEIEGIKKRAGLTLNEGYSVRDKVSICAKYEIKKEEPRRMKLCGNINPKRLERFFSEWFDYIQAMDYEPWQRIAAEVASEKSKHNETIEYIMSSVEGVHKSEYNDKVKLIGKGARLFFEASSSSIRLDLNGYSLSDGQKIEIFKYIESITK